MDFVHENNSMHSGVKVAYFSERTQSADIEKVCDDLSCCVVETVKSGITI